MERGLIEFIHTKIMAGNTEESIRAALRVAGISEQVITDGFSFVRQKYPDIHQDVVASNNFLPPLRKKVTSFDVRGIDDHEVDTKEGFFAGRLRRRDFILGLILVSGLAIIFITAVSSFLQIASMDAYKRALSMVVDPTYRDAALLALVLLPFIIKMFDLVIRRLHDIGVMGLPSVVLLAPGALMFDVGMRATEIIVVVSVLFLLFLLLKRGTQGANKFGEHYPYHGGFLQRIFYR